MIQALNYYDLFPPIPARGKEKIGRREKLPAYRIARIPYFKGPHMHLVLLVEQLVKTGLSVGQPAT